MLLKPTDLEKILHSIWCYQRSCQIDQAL